VKRQVPDAGAGRDRRRPVDACVAWQGHDVQLLVSGFCAQHGIPAAFYDAFSSRE
jgi:hypothetical protein